MTGTDVLRGSVRDQRGPVASAALLFMGHQAGEALVPVLVGVVVDRAVATGDPGALLLWLGVLGLDFAVLSFCYRWGARRAWLGDVVADQRLRLLVADRVLDPRGGAEAGRLPGDLASVATTDAKRVGVVNFALPLGVAAVAAMVVAAVALLAISVPLGLLVLLGTPLLLGAVSLLGRPLERRSGPEQEQAARASGIAADLVDGVRVLKGLRAEPAAVRRYVAASRGALDATLGATRAQAGYQGSVLAANGLFLALVALVGGRMAAEGTISVGELVSAVGLAQFLVTPLQIAGWVNGRLAQGRASAARIAGVLAADPAVGAGHVATPAVVGGSLLVKGLWAGTLRGVDLEARSGELVGVVTRDPAEAAALVRCLAREVDPTEGVLELDGVDLHALAPSDARRAVVVAAHDAVLFAGTLAENAAAAAAAPAAAEAPPARGTGGAERGPRTTPQCAPRSGIPPLVGAALAASSADQVAEVLPDGVDTAVSEQGRSLSGGQRQRVALARALATDAPVLVLHDPTTAVDTVTEARIAEGIATLRAGRTTLLVATRPALLDRADRVLLIDAGRVVASGVHTDLLARADYREAVSG